MSHPLTRNSLLVRVKADMGGKILPLSEKRIIQLELEVNPCLDGFFDAVDVEFNIETKKTFVRSLLISAWTAHAKKLGTTTVEVKSGYGLDTENEVKMLRAIKNVGDRVKDKIEVVSTYCGAHAIPKGKTEEEQTADVINNQIPAIHVLCSRLRI